MDAINIFIDKIPLSRINFGYTLIGVGSFILLLVVVFFIVGKQRNKSKVNYSASPYDQKMGATGVGRSQARLAGAINTTPSSVPQGGAVPPPPSTPNFVQPVKTPSSGGLKGLQTKTEFSAKPAGQIKDFNTPNTPPVPVGMESYASPKASIPATKVPPKPNFGLETKASTPPPPQGMAKEVNMQTKPVPLSIPEPVPEKVLATPPVDAMIIDYIKKTRTSGHSDSAIRSELVKSGWNPIDIDRGLGQK